MAQQDIDEKAIFNVARKIESPDARAEYVRQITNGDQELAERVIALVGGYQQEHGILEAALADQHPIESQIPSTLDGTKIGPYLIREQIGEGGMGVVYVAEQTEPVQRKVALKIIKPGMDTKEVIARFEAERQALAFMEHPNIARVLDAGATESGRSYFVMELVRGIPITEYCDQVKATPRERLELFQTVCDAVQHAHQKGIIHRDIKPSNVLVTQVSAKPMVKVIDFGLAKAVSGQRLTEKTLYTGFMKLMGTPAYMSPEQAGLSGLDIDTRSDIYSLGVVLYELLTGTTPLDKTEIQEQAYDELCRQIREVDAPKPSTRFSTLKGAERSTIAEQRQIEPRELRRLLDGDLDLVVLKAVEKDRDRRYGTPVDLAADLERFLDNKPVLAVPPSQSYIARKYIRRHQTAIITAMTILSFLIVATVFSSWQAIRATAAGKTAREKTAAAEVSERAALAAQQDAETAREIALDSQRRAEQSDQQRRRQLYAYNMQLADQLWNTKTATPIEIQELLAAWFPTDDRLADLREFAWRYQWNRLHFSADQTVHDVNGATFSPIGNLIVANHAGIREWDDNRKALVERWQSAGPTQQVELSPCGRWAAASLDDSMQLIDIKTGVPIHTVTSNRARFSSDGEHVLTWHQDVHNRKSNNYAIWSLSSGTSTQLPHVEGTLEKAGSVSSDGKSLLIQAPDNPGLLSAFLGGEVSGIKWYARGEVECSAWSPNGELVASGHFGGHVILRFADSPAETLALETRRNAISALTFSNDSTQLAVASDEGTVDLYDLAHLAHRQATIGELSANPNAHDGLVPEPRDLQSLSPPRLIRTLNAHVSRVVRVVFSKDDSRLATCDREGTAKLWFVDQQPHVLPDTEFSGGMIGDVGVSFVDGVGGVEVSHVSASCETIKGDIQAGDRLLAIINDQGEKYPLDVMTDAGDVYRWSKGTPNTVVTCHLLDAESHANKTVQLLRRTRDERQFIYNAIAFQSGVGILLTTTEGTYCRSHGGQVIRTFQGIKGGQSCAISPDGRTLALDDGKDLVLWDTQADEILGRLKSLGRLHCPYQNNMGGNISFSPDGKLVAMGTGFRLNAEPKSRQADLHVWDVSSLKKVASPLQNHNRCISGVVFTPDGRTLCATDIKGVIRFWDTSTWKLKNTINGLFDANSIDVSADGRWLAQGGYQGIAIWDLATLDKRHVIRGKSTTRVRFSNDGRTLGVTRTDGSVQLRDSNTGMPLATLDTKGGFLTDCDFTADGQTLVALGATGKMWRMDAESIEQLDQHPLTMDALFQRGVAQIQDEQFEAAEQTLRYVLKLQRRTLSDDDAEVMRTRERLVELLKSQSKFPAIALQPSSQRVALGAATRLDVEAATDNCVFQWFYEGGAIKNATHSTLELPAVTRNQLGIYHVEVRLEDPQLDLVVESCRVLLANDENSTAKGWLRYDQFLDVPGTDVADLSTSSKYPHRPDSTSAIDSFEIPDNLRDDYGVRVSGYLVPPKTGNYIFYISSDDSSELLLSRDESPHNRKPIAELHGWHPAREWETLKPESISKPILLEARKRYWVEALYKEGGGRDHLAVAWQIPGKPPPKNGDPPISREFLEFQLE